MRYPLVCYGVWCRESLWQTIAGACKADNLGGAPFGKGTVGPCGIRTFWLSFSFCWVGVEKFFIVSCLTITEKVLINEICDKLGVSSEKRIILEDDIKDYYEVAERITKHIYE